MPYIKSYDRENIKLGSKKPQTSGELNFKITLSLIDYIQLKGKSYQTFNDILCALEGAKQELYRRVIQKYEEQKIIENGDVYDGNS